MARLHRGDTLIELMLAFAIFSLAAVSCLTILNQGVAMAQRSLEKSLVRQQVDSQAEIIRYIQASGDSAWTTMVGDKSVAGSTGRLVTAAGGPLPLSGPCPSVGQLSSGGANGFFVVPKPSGAGFDIKPADAANYTAASTYAQVTYGAATPKAYGMWVQVVKAENATPNPALRTVLDAYDFYIHGCWDSVGLAVPMTVGTIVRVYDR